MPEHPNASLIRHGHPAFSAGDVVTLTQVLSTRAGEARRGTWR